MRLVFMGTPRFAVPSLKRLVDSGHQVGLVVTQPDRPAGRGRHPTPPPVKEAARVLGLSVLQPEKLSQPEVKEAVRSLGPEAICVVAFGQKIPKWLLALPRFGCINVHPSLLPRWRGAAPITAALLAGDRETGVSTMLLDEGWDTGPVLLQRPTPIGPEENAGELEARLAEMGADLLVETLAELAAGRLRPKPQPEEGACYAPRFTGTDGLLSFDRPAEELVRRVRAFTPEPGAYTFHKGTRLRVWRARLASPAAVEPAAALPGEVVATEPGLIVQASPGRLVLEILQPAGKRPMTAAEYLRGHPLHPGDRLGREAEG
ncbi:MAG TPA: methionyl-tRNA formyltransferase [Firmicutes bacterium]|nr:methionyl-tRNA formyltransferase [Bacillota bacterium]